MTQDKVRVPLLTREVLEHLRAGFADVYVPMEAYDEYKMILQALDYALASFDTGEVVNVALMPLTQQSTDLLKKSGKVFVIDVQEGKNENTSYQ